jgi:LPS-assembly protein
MLQDLDRRDPQGDSDEALPLLVSPDDPEAETPAVEFAPRALELPDAWDPRLHAGLPWEFCGPRSGAPGSPAPRPRRAAQGIPVQIVADRVDYDRNTEVIQLRGGVDVEQADQRMLADRSTYDRRSGRLDASGMSFSRPRDCASKGTRPITMS